MAPQGHPVIKSCFSECLLRLSGINWETLGINKPQNILLLCLNAFLMVRSRSCALRFSRGSAANKDYNGQWGIVINFKAITFGANFEIIHLQGSCLMLGKLCY